MIKDMTKGNIPKHLIGFSIPLVVGNLLQLTYNAVDSIVVGRFSGTDALAAVGAANPVMNIAILGITGICIGASVLMSEFFGAGKHEELKKEISTTLIFGCFFSLLIVVLGLIFSKGILRLLGVPNEILDSSALYLRIIFVAMPFTYLYNAVSAAMRSVGDSKTPIRFLAIASILNGCLDFIFIGGFNMGVLGAGLATAIAEACSAVFCIIYIYIKVPLLRLTRSDIRIDMNLLKKTLQHGSITALQQSCQPIGKLLIQSFINPLGIAAIAAFNAVNRVDDFAFTPQQSISSGIMTFVAQNRGANNKRRIKDGFRIGLFVEFCYWILICIVILFLKEPIMKLFVSSEDTSMINLGVHYLGLMAFFYILPSFTNGIQGFFRGMGNMKITLISTLIQISFRTLFVYLLVHRIGMVSVAYASLIGWILMLAYEVPYYFAYKRKNDILKDSNKFEAKMQLQE
ncbi:MATE family efflux transporter [Clostridium chromiireducens]|uniref:MATE family efflux transporter n=1 Tax=Clostridium chromiireducens TaxID=225345 RepID=A0A1V4J0K0_9CLOT|nr:MATE family efflux transporter [Clostridium chromiireducens]OPJ65620.1 multidrug export protein MepA [Clostridium chromiireducens]RII34865.1 MATE family efflux transporter [Clostridium chromiireducens]